MTYSGGNRGSNPKLIRIKLEFVLKWSNLSIINEDKPPFHSFWAFLLISKRKGPSNIWKHWELTGKLTFVHKKAGFFVPKNLYFLFKCYETWHECSSSSSKSFETKTGVSRDKILMTQSFYDVVSTKNWKIRIFFVITSVYLHKMTKSSQTSQDYLLIHSIPFQTKTMLSQAFVLLNSSLWRHNFA